MLERREGRVVVSLWLNTLLFVAVVRLINHFSLIRDDGLGLLVTTFVALCPLLFWGRGLKAYKEDIKDISLFGFFTVVFLFCVGICFNFIGTISTVPLEGLLNQVGYTAKESLVQNKINEGTITFIIYSCILGPIFEEVVYRGGLQTLLAPYGKKRAILISALIFGFMHHDLYQAIAAAALGIVFAYGRDRYGLLFAIILHICNNTFVTLVAHFKPIGFAVPAFAVIGLIIFIVALIKKRVYLSERFQRIGKMPYYILLPILGLFAYEVIYTLVESIHRLG
ncbi:MULTISPECIES: CPBP family intramembrane glutamic endopeptidase [Streptococcus]|uniref:Membrane protease YdiL (CAAX protease family) n=1 Tax=Streptococcus gallinaceus TaxID=165758 RepID=A0ABV2JIZ0_9STRE|nr:CPBP family glutamic-type intramembrane protease [uncultured Peptostreptococcus sp.]HEM3615026.1 CPBP family intramembrane metalloprotease [Streptococcus suis]HEM3635441.1 CPBP family intramembrane metalloprotease [Streptococcus suis]HEM3704711.1 CPBP family intramembrane metalloprotease [Streptococcus suis]